jgi:perosamine synthetase
MYKIPVYQPCFSGNEKKYVLDCLESTWISSKGKYISLFENEFSKFTGIKYSAGVCNGTVALHLALIALGIGPEDEVIVPTLTYIASVNAITYTGAKVVFADSLLDTWQLSPADVELRITPKTKAIMAVHLYGQPCDMDALVAIAKKHKVFLIEDCAEAFGSLYKNKHVGTFGDISTFSFFGNKTITTGEGGMVCTSDETLFDRVVHFKGQGLARYREYWHDVIGYNYRMTNICAAIGLAQLELAQNTIKKKIIIAELYKENLADLPVIIQPQVGDVLHTYWMFSILVKKAEDRDSLRKKLSDNGIETRPVFYPVHTMPMYSTKYQKYPVAESIGWRGINLPSWPGLSENDIKNICSVIESFFKGDA